MTPCVIVFLRRIGVLLSNEPSTSAYDDQYFTVFAYLAILGVFFFFEITAKIQDFLNKAGTKKFDLLHVISVLVVIS